MAGRRQSVVNASTLLVLGMGMLLMPFEKAAAARDPFQPGANYSVVPPYPGYRFLAASNFKRVNFVLTTCRWARTEIYLTRKPLKLHYPERTVTATVPDTLNLADPETVNGLIVAAWQKAWRDCAGIANVDGPLRPAFNGVRVIVVQKKNIAIATDRTVVTSSGRISAPSIQNVVMERAAERLRQEQEVARQQQEVARQEQEAATRQQLLAEADRRRQIAAAEAAAERQAFTQTVTTVFWVSALVIILYWCFRFGPVVLGYVRYFFMPHPAGSIVERATRRDASHPVNGPALASALRYSPRTSTEQNLATEDLRNMTDRVRRETEFLSESEKLARMTIEMEKQRARVDELKQGYKGS